jgi:hypothetical protein
VANGTIHKLGTLYVANAKKARPTKPWQDTNGSAPDTGNLLDYGNGSNAIEIKDTDSNDAYKLQWVEVNDGSDKILICDRNLLMDIQWNRLNALGFCGAKGSGKKITIDGQQYELFMLTGGASSSAQSEITASNEWDKYIGNLGKFSGLPTPQSQDLQNSSSSANFTTAHNRIWNWAGCYSWCQNTTTNGSSYRAWRGYFGARYWNNSYSNNYDGDIGWRPALRVLNAAPRITPASKSYGELNKPQNISFSVSDPDGDTFDVIVKIDEVQKESYESQTGRSYTFQMSKYWDSLGLGNHTVAVIAIDSKGDAKTVAYTFRKINHAPTVSPTTLNSGDLKKPRNIEYTISDSDDDDLTVVVKIDNTEKERYTAQRNGARTFQMSKYWPDLKLGTHTVAITVTDSWNEAATATYSFTKTNGSAEAPTITSPLSGERRKNSFYVEFTIGSDAEGDTQTVRIQAADNIEMTKNLKEFTRMEKKTDAGWIQVTSASNEDVKSAFRINVNGMSGEKYIRVVSTDTGSGMDTNSSVIHVRIGTVLEVQMRPQDTSKRIEKTIVLLDLTADEKITKEIWVTNNANDDSPSWETYTPDSAGNHTFENIEKTADKWAVAVKVKITANNSTEEISLRAIGMGVL